MSSEFEASFMLMKMDYYRKLLKIEYSPYFGRVDFTENGCDLRKVYIGLTNVEKDLDYIVYDWRSPIASLFYDYGIGKAKYESPEGEINGDISLRRQYKIENNKLVRVFDNDLNVVDECLQEVLSEKSSDKMKNIVNTIQEEQNEIIRNTKNKHLIVQGIAGSGINAIPDRVDSIAGNISNGLNGLYEATHTEDESEARQNRILDKQALRDPERIRKYQENLKVSKKAARRIMKEEAQKYWEAGVTDDKLIIKAMKASEDDFGVDRAAKQRIILAQMAEEVGDNQKKLKHLKEGLVERGVPRGDIDKYIKTIKDINKII